MKTQWRFAPANVIAFLLYLNPPKPSLTVREGPPRARCPRGSPANWRNVGDGEMLPCPLSPSGMRLGLVRGTLFPLRVRLTFGSPGLPGCWRHCCFRRTWGNFGGMSRLSPLWGTLYFKNSCSYLNPPKPSQTLPYRKGGPPEGPLP